MAEKENLEDIILGTTQKAIAEGRRTFKLYMYGGLAIVSLVVLVLLTGIVKLILL